MPLPCNSNFSSERTAFRPGTEDVLGGVDITVVSRAALGTRPVPHSKRAHTFRAAIGYAPAARTRLGSPSFVGFDVLSVVPSGFVSKLTTQYRPTGVVHRLCHPCLGQAGRTDVSDNDQRVLPSYLGGPLMEVMTPGVGYLGVDSLDAALVVGSLCDSELFFVLPVVLQGREFAPITASGDGLEAKVDTDLAVSSRLVLFNLALESDVPAPPCILGEASGLKLTCQFAVFPEPEVLLEVDGFVAPYPDRARDEGNPAQSAPRTTTGAEARAPSKLVSRSYELAADGLHRVRVQAQLGGASSAQADEIVGSRPSDVHPALAALLCLALHIAAVVPNEVHSLRVAVEVLAGGGVFDAVFERQDHAIILLLRTERAK